MTIYDFLNLTQQSKPFIGEAVLPAVVVTDEFQHQLTEYIRWNYRGYIFQKFFQALRKNQAFAEVEKAVGRACDSVYISHAYAYKTLAESMEFDYNPIENYNMTEKEKTSDSGTDTLTRAQNAHTDKETLGERVDNNMLGNQTNSVSYSQQENNKTLTENVAPFESQDYKNVNKSFDVETLGTHTDNQSIGGRDDILTKGQQENTMAYGEQNGTDTTNYGKVEDRELTRSGNIGVTTTQQMLEQERQIARFSFVKLVANDIIHALCVCYTGGGL